MYVCESVYVNVCMSVCVCMYVKVCMYSVIRFPKQIHTETVHSNIQERFLTVCGKCGGNIEEVDALDKRLMGRILPTDRPVYCCVTCAQVCARGYYTINKLQSYFHLMNRRQCMCCSIAVLVE